MGNPQNNTKGGKNRSKNTFFSHKQRDLRHHFTIYISGKASFWTENAAIHHRICCIEQLLDKAFAWNLLSCSRVFHPKVLFGSEGCWGWSLPMSCTGIVQWIASYFSLITSKQEICKPILDQSEIHLVTRLAMSWLCFTTKRAVMPSTDRVARGSFKQCSILSLNLVAMTVCLENLEKEKMKIYIFVVKATSYQSIFQILNQLLVSCNFILPLLFGGVEKKF